MRFGKALPVLLLFVSCALYACAGRGGSPAPAEPDREYSQGTPLQGSPVVVEQRIGQPVRSQTQTPAAQTAAPVPARQSTAASRTTPQARPEPIQTNSGYITLQPGETISYISALYGISEKDLIAWNGLLSAHDIRAGQRLTIRPPGMQGVPSARTAPATAPQTATSVRAETAPDGTITVAPGQSLSSIAQSHGATVAQLREWNGLTSDTLRAGQRLRVQPPHARASGSIGAPLAEKSAAPVVPDADGTITVQSGQSLSAIAAKYKVSTADLRRWNKLQNDQLQIGQKLRVKAPVRIHTVKGGESLGGIAAKYKVSVKDLMQKNKLANADMLPLGKELIIP